MVPVQGLEHGVSHSSVLPWIQQAKHRQGNSSLVSPLSAHICLRYKSKIFIKGQNKLAKGIEANAAEARDSQDSQMESGALLMVCVQHILLRL